MGRRIIPGASGVALTPAQELELRSGPDFATAMAARPWRRSLFRSEADRRAAWEAHAERLTDDDAEPGQRPWAFWRYEIKREDLAGAPDKRDPERTAILAAGGYLTAEEIAALRRRAAEAEARLDTDEERGTLLEDDLWDPDTGDRLEAAIGEVLEAAIRKGRLACAG